MVEHLSPMVMLETLAFTASTVRSPAPVYNAKRANERSPQKSPSERPSATERIWSMSDVVSTGRRRELFLAESAGHLAL